MGACNAKTALVLSDFGLKNYGNRLQSYAVLSLLRGYGVDGVVAAQFDGALEWRVKDIVKMALPSALWRKKKRYSRFRKFARQYTPYQVVDLKRFYDLATQFDCAVVGSDQVWSPTYLARWSNPSIYFLSELSSRKKIALAPSIGLASIPERLGRIYADGLLTFERLSVREEVGAQLIKQLSDIDAVVLADPTIGVKDEEWRSIADYSICPKKRYVLTYYLGDGLDYITDAVADYAAKNSLEIVNLMDENKRFYDSGPAEFIGLIDQANYVVTDSFHGSVFSMLLHTPFSVIRRTDPIGSEMFSRIETLASKFGCWDRVIDGKNCIFDENGIDWDALDGRVISERDRILDYLAEELVRCGLV